MLQYQNLNKGNEMKLKFVLVPLVVLGFAVGSYADCSKDEIMKLLDKGYSKSEVDGVCGKSAKKTDLVWGKPNSKTCIANGGKMSEGVCTSTWSVANNICSVLNGQLPNIYELSPTSSSKISKSHILGLLSNTK
jgi:hypothetical protein